MRRTTGRERPRAKYALFAAWLEDERAKLDGLTVTELAEHLGVSPSMTSNYLAGKQRPERKSLRKIATARTVEPAFLEELLDADETPDVIATYEQDGELRLMVAEMKSTLEHVRDLLEDLHAGMRGRWPPPPGHRRGAPPDEADPAAG